MALTHEKKAHIESDANIAYPINLVYPVPSNIRSSFVESYISGATAEAEKAAKLVEVLGLVEKCKGGMAEYLARHDYRLMYDMYKCILDAATEALTATAPQQEAAQETKPSDKCGYLNGFSSRHTPAAQGKEVEFAEWIRVNYSPIEDEPDLWMQCATNTKYLQTKIPDLGAYTTAELFELFKSQL